MSTWTLALVGAAVLGLATNAIAQDPRGEGRSFGANQYQARCAACHGDNGKGDGTVAKAGKMKLPDLTTYAKRNGGKFPVDLAWNKIDGRPVAWDSKSQMPAWGNTFRHEVTAPPYSAKDPETYVAAEIRAILSHLEEMQVK